MEGGRDREKEGQEHGPSVLGGGLNGSREDLTHNC